MIYILSAFLRHSAALILTAVLFFSGLQMQPGTTDPLAPCGTTPAGIQTANAGPCDWLGCEGGDAGCFQMGVNIYGIVITVKCFQPYPEEQKQLPEEFDFDMDQLPETGTYA